MNATDCYGVTERGRCEIDGIEYVGYYDGARSYAVLATEYDDVGDEPRDDAEWRANAYSEWCSRCTSVSRDVTAAVAALLELDGLWASDGTDTWCEPAADNDDREYRIAFVCESGDWDVVQSFDAADDDAAMDYAESEYGDRDWYVLDSQGRNISGGPGQDA